MGQSISIQRDTLLGRNEGRPSQSRAGRTTTELDCLDGGPTMSELNSEGFDRRQQRLSRRRRSHRLRRDIFRRSVGLDNHAARLGTAPGDATNMEIGDSADRPPTPFDSGEIVLDESPPALESRSSNMPSPLASLLRRGTRMMHSRSASALADADDEVLPDLRSPARRPLSSRLSTMIGGSQGLRGSRNRLSTILTSPADSPRLLRRRRNMTEVSPSLPIESDAWPWDEHSSLAQSTGMDLLDGSGLDVGPVGSSIASTPRRSRLSRVRDSLLPPVPPFLHYRPGRHSQQLDPRLSLTTPSRSTFGGADTLLPHIPTPTMGLDMPQAQLSPTEMETMPSFGFDHAGFDRASRSPHTDRLPRRATGGSQPNAAGAPNGEDQAARLSRHLSVAATAIAASLVGNTERAFSDAHDVASDGVDGSFDSFLRALQNGSLASALRNGGNGSGEDGATNAADGAFSPINFFRIFRFGSSGDHDNSSGNGSNATGQDHASSSSEAHAENGGRMVPVIIVGIRSVTPRESVNQDDGNINSPLFDALSNLPLIMPAGLPSRGSGTVLRRTDRRSRFGRSRRASMSAVSSFPANYDSQRHQRVHSGAGRPPFEPRPSGTATVPSGLSESPPGPHPPPSTPAEHQAMSAGSSGNNTPHRRPSSASGGPVASSAGPAARSASTHMEPSIDEMTEPPIGARRRRLSDGEFARYRDFGPGSSRRNGIVGDTEVDPGSASFAGAPQPEGTRTWIVYVLGGSYPEDHPILTTPSLFTDSPTYEDMLLLSSILGPAKPPVASREEVASAPGVYRIAATADSWVAASSNTGDEPLVIEAGERCLICLCEYAVDEEVRQLSRCRHVYHRECIDEWLVTGRNSCPLCRGQGVAEKNDSSSDSAPASASPAPGNGTTTESSTSSTPAGAPPPATGVA